MNDLHGWITQQVDQVEATARAASADLNYVITQVQYIDDLIKADGRHIDSHLPVAVLRRCEADRRILARHYLATDWDWSFDAPCHGCGTSGYDDTPNTDNVNDCPELLDLAHAHGLTDEILASLDRPVLPARPKPKLHGPDPDTHHVPAALRGPNWSSR